VIVNSMHISQQDHPPDILGPILKPFTSLIIQIDKEVIFYFFTICRAIQ